MIIFIFWLLIAAALAVWYAKYVCEDKCCNPEKRIDEEDKQRGGL